MLMVVRFNTILLDFDRDRLGLYFYGLLQTENDLLGEIGSSTNGQTKLTPIDFEKTPKVLGTLQTPIIGGHLSGEVCNFPAGSADLTGFNVCVPRLLGLGTRLIAYHPA